MGRRKSRSKLDRPGDEYLEKLRRSLRQGSYPPKGRTPWGVRPGGTLTPRIQQEAQSRQDLRFKTPLVIRHEYPDGTSRDEGTPPLPRRRYAPENGPLQVEQPVEGASAPEGGGNMDPICPLLGEACLGPRCAWFVTPIRACVLQAIFIQEGEATSRVASLLELAKRLWIQEGMNL